MSRVIISRSSPTRSGETFMRVRASSLPPGMDLSTSAREIHVQPAPGASGATRILLTRNGNIHSVDRINADSSFLSHSPTSGYGNSIISSDYNVLHSSVNGIVINTAPLTPVSHRNTNAVAYQLIQRQPTLSSVSTKQSNNSIFIGQSDFREHQYEHQAKSFHLKKTEPESTCLKPPLPSPGVTTFRIKTGNGSTGFLINGIPGSAQRICLRGNNTSIGIKAPPNFRVYFPEKGKIRVVSGGSLDNIHSAIHNSESPDENSYTENTFLRLHKSKPNQPSLLINRISAPMYHQQDRRSSSKGIYSRVKIPSTAEESRRHDFYAMDSLKLYEAQLDLNDHSQQSPPNNQFVTRSSYRLGDYRSTFKPQKDTIPPQGESFFFPYLSLHTAPPRTFFTDRDCSRNQTADLDLKRNYYLPQSNQIDVKTTIHRSEEYDSLTSTVLKKRFKSSDQTASGSTMLDLPSQDEVIIVDNSKQSEKEDAINNNTLLDQTMDQTLSAAANFFPVKTSDSIRLLPPNFCDYSSTLPLNDTLTATLASTLSGGSSSLPSEELLDVSRSFSNQCSLEDGQDLLSDPASRNYAGDMISDLDGDLQAHAHISIHSESEDSPTGSQMSNDTYAFSTLDSEYLQWMSYNIRPLSQFEVERTQCAAANLLEFAADDLLSLISQFNMHCLSDWTISCKSDDGELLIGTLRVFINLVRPVKMSLTQITMEVSGDKNSDAPKEAPAAKLVSFFMPRGTSQMLQITNHTTAGDIIKSLLERFHIQESVKKFTLCEHTLQAQTIVVRKFALSDRPLSSLLLWVKQAQLNGHSVEEFIKSKRLVLQENDQNEIDWGKFQEAELRTFLKILDKEEEEYRESIKSQYGILMKTIEEKMNQLKSV